MEKDWASWVKIENVEQLKDGSFRIVTGESVGGKYRNIAIKNGKKKAGFVQQVGPRCCSKYAWLLRDESGNDREHVAAFVKVMSENYCTLIIGYKERLLKRLTVIKSCESDFIPLSKRQIKRMIRAHQQLEVVESLPASWEQFCK